MDKNTRTLTDLLDALAELGARHALVGGLVAGYYGKGRATVDVDLLVPKRFMKRLKAALERRGYEVRAFPDMMRMYVPGEPESVGDLVVKEANPVLRAAFAATTPVTLLGLPVNIVQRGAFVALKFHAAVSPTRQLGDKIQDVADIVRVPVPGQRDQGPQRRRSLREQRPPCERPQVHAQVHDPRSLPTTRRAACVQGGATPWFRPLRSGLPAAVTMLSSPSPWRDPRCRRRSSFRC